MWTEDEGAIGMCIVLVVCGLEDIREDAGGRGGGS